MIAVLQHAAWRRRFGLAGWALAIAAVTALVAVAYPAIRDNAELDRTFANLSPGLQAVFGLANGTTLTSPVGYLNSQFFTNTLPVMLLIFAIGTGAWGIAGDESAGTLELLLANPVSRTRVALARVSALALFLAALVTLSAVTLVAVAPSVGLTTHLSVWRLVAAALASGTTALTFGALAFAVGAAGRARSVALSVPASLAVAGYVIEGIAEPVHLLRPLRAISPWHWLIGGDPLARGLTWQVTALPLAVSLLLILAGTWRLTRRDLR